MVDARLPDGSRVNAIIPPLALNGPTLTIRKFSRDPYTMDDLINFGSITPKAAQFLAACVNGKLNVLISGGTGHRQDDDPERDLRVRPGRRAHRHDRGRGRAQLQQEHVITLESRPPNIEGQGEIRIRELVRNALRMRPDRIIVGEVRGAETLDMLQAMNTGHDGSLTTIHANSPRDALARLETLVLTAGVDLPLRAIREQIASAFDLLVQITRLVDGSRRVSHITEVLRMESEVITLQDIFHAKPPDEETAIGPCARQTRLSAAALVHGAEASLPREDGLTRSHAPAELLRRGGHERVPVDTLCGEFRRVLVSRRAAACLALIGALTLLAPAAQAGVTVKGIDTSSYPQIRVSVVTSAPTTSAPSLAENGHGVPLAGAQNSDRRSRSSSRSTGRSR